MIEQSEIDKIPKLPYGEGSIVVSSDGKRLVYAKRISGKRKYVYGTTVKEVLQKMREKDKDSQKEQFKTKTITLNLALRDWLINTKQPTLKPKSYDRLECTIKNQIEKFNIGKIRYQEVKSNDIQKHIQELVSREYSWSTIKKTYDALNDFFRDKTINKEIEHNPMLIVKMPSKENVLKPIKEIEFFDDEDIKKFTDEASKLMLTQNRPKYQLGFIFIAWIYLGMRVGELIALRIKDVDMVNKTILINKSIGRVINRDYDESNPELMKKKKITKYIDKEGSTKNYATRILHMNNKAYEYMQQHLKYSNHKNSDDYLIATRDGGVNNIKNITDRLKGIEVKAGTKVQGGATHVLRHTCASLYFRQGVQVEIIASILGNSADVCRTTYVHFIEEQQRQASNSITRIDIE